MSALEELKVTLDDFKNNRIAELSDRPSADGMSPEDLKLMFDAGAINVLMPALNALIDYLIQSGASGIGVDKGGSIVDLQTLMDTVVCFAESNAKYIRVNSKGRLETSADNKIWFAVGTGEAGTAREIGAVACNIPMTLIVNDKKGLTLMYEE